MSNPSVPHLAWSMSSHEFFSYITARRTRFSRYISHMPQSRNWERKIGDGPPCVVLASPGFMQSGTSRQFLEMWAPDPRNGCLITGYSVEGTMARVCFNLNQRRNLALFSRCNRISPTNPKRSLQFMGKQFPDVSLLKEYHSLHMWISLKIQSLSNRSKLVTSCVAVCSPWCFALAKTCGYRCLCMENKMPWADCEPRCRGGIKIEMRTSNCTPHAISRNFRSASVGNAWQK